MGCAQKSRAGERLTALPRFLPHLWHLQAEAGVQSGRRCGGKAPGWQGLAGRARLARDAGGTHAPARASHSPGWSRAGLGCSVLPAPRLGPELRLRLGLFEQY